MAGKPNNAEIIREKRQQVLQSAAKIGLKLIGETVIDGDLVLTFDDGGQSRIPLPDPFDRPELTSHPQPRPPYAR